MIYELQKDKITFPNPLNSSDNLPLAFGGDLQSERLLVAYKNGIFPWYSENSPILWWSPNPRAVLFPQDFKISKSLKQNLKKYTTKINKNFYEVIKNCANIKRKEQGTWLHEEMINAYLKLHELGFAHSIETYEDDLLIGGVYGLNFGNIFCGESMFSKKSNASKVALFQLSRILQEKNGFIDTQVQNPHLVSLGSCEISREDFLKKLKTQLHEESIFLNINSFIL